MLRILELFSLCSVTRLHGKQPSLTVKLKDRDWPFWIQKKNEALFRHRSKNAREADPSFGQCLVIFLEFVIRVNEVAISSPT